MFEIFKRRTEIDKVIDQLNTYIKENKNARDYSKSKIKSLKREIIEHKRNIVTFNEVVAQCEDVLKTALAKRK